MNILIVDDNPTSRLLLHEIMKPYGKVKTVVNGIEAIEEIIIGIGNNDTYDLVCLDIMMPEMDGQTALRHIRKAEENAGIFSDIGIKIIMTTALNDFQNIQSAYSGLCDGYLVKPISKIKMLSTLKQLKLINK